MCTDPRVDMFDDGEDIHYICGREWSLILVVKIVLPQQDLQTHLQCERPEHYTHIYIYNIVITNLPNNYN